MDVAIRIGPASLFPYPNTIIQVSKYFATADFRLGIIIDENAGIKLTIGLVVVNLAFFKKWDRFPANPNSELSVVVNVTIGECSRCRIVNVYSLSFVAENLTIFDLQL